MKLMAWSDWRVVFLAVVIAGGALRGDEPLTICCAGDSLMRPIPAHLRAIAAAQNIALDIREWAQGGLNSDTYRSFFRRNEGRWTGTRCDAILLQLGTNDVVPLLEGRTTAAEVRARIREILAVFAKFEGRRRPRPLILMATVPRFCESLESAAKNEAVESTVNPILKEAAAAEGAVLVDSHAVLLNRPDLFDPDCVHPNAAGERALAENWWRVIRGMMEDHHDHA